MTASLHVESLPGVQTDDRGDNSHSENFPEISWIFEHLEVRNSSYKCDCMEDSAYKVFVNQSGQNCLSRMPVFTCLHLDTAREEKMYE